MHALNNLEQQLLTLINQHRQAKGLPALKQHLEVQKEAKRHCEHMKLGIVKLGHEGFEHRANRLMRETGAQAVAENIAEGNNDLQTILQEWLNSDAHRKNIEGDFDQTGIAVEQNKKGDWIYLQLFVGHASSPDFDALIDTDELTKQVLQLVNQYRSKQGLPALQADDKLKELALQHAAAMAAGKTPFGHDGFESRANEAIDSTGGKSVAENVANGNVAVQKIVSNWIQSDGHRKNIEGDFSHTGIGVEKSVNGNIFYTQLFVKS